MGYLIVSCLMLSALYFISSEGTPTPQAIDERGYLEKVQAPHHRQKRRDPWEYAREAARIKAAETNANPYGPYSSGFRKSSQYHPDGPPDVSHENQGANGKSEQPIEGSVVGIQDNDPEGGNCVGEGKQGECERCQVSKQCSRGRICCPEKKVCVKESCFECEGGESAQCKPGCGDKNVYSQFHGCSCKNTQFPDLWAPQCGSLAPGEKEEYVWQTKTDVSHNKCHPRFETKFKRKCEDYAEQNCYTKHVENCTHTSFDNCQAIPKEKHDRQCRDVVEKICQFEKSYEDKIISTQVKKQVCHEESKRVCDTTYVMDQSTTSDYKCVDVGIPVCKEEWKTVYDETCTTKYDFDCTTKAIENGYGNNNILKRLKQVNRYKLHPGRPAPDFLHGNMNHNPRNINAMADEFRCIQTPNRQCTKTKRRVKIQKCTQSSKPDCHMLTNRRPNPKEEQICHSKPIEVCELVNQEQEKHLQVPTHTLKCNPVTKNLCDNFATTTLEVKCVQQQRPVCEWIPERMECVDTPRQHCYQLPYQVQTTDCAESYTGGLGLPFKPKKSKGYRQR